MKSFSFRFDIDTPDCLKKGVPRLMSLAEKLDVQFTFFLSVGHSISRLGTLSRMLNSKPEEIVSAPAFSARHKLGALPYLHLALFNPMIGLKSPALVKSLSQSQDMGLHGGKNHDVWHHQAQGWTQSTLAKDLDWSLAWLNSQNIIVNGFSCPGWTEPPHLSEELHARGFKYRADLHGPNSKSKIEANGLVNLATNLIGEPGGVAYLETLRAQKKTNSEIRDLFKQSLLSINDCVVAYDHPYFAGIHELDTIEDMIKIARDQGYQILPLSRVADQVHVERQS